MFTRLAAKQVIGLNRREIDFISPENSRYLIQKVAHNKLYSKKILADAGLPVPETFASFDRHEQVRAFDFDSIPDSFAVKPAGGGRGCGILIVLERHITEAIKNKKQFKVASGTLINYTNLRFHLIDILDGAYSREGRNRDLAYIEERLVTSRDITGELCFGLPDIRIVVHRGRPLLAMMRIATKASGGRANLHQGAVGIGVDIETGETLSAVQDGKACTTHPDHGKNVVGIRVPSWRDLVSIAKKAAQVSGLGYTGIDLALDDKSGPKILEINARPGLDIQIANLRGLFTE